MGQSERKPAELIDIKDASAFLAKNRAEKKQKDPPPKKQLDKPQNDDERLTQAMQIATYELLEGGPTMTPMLLAKLIRNIGYELTYNDVIGRIEDRGCAAPQHIVDHIQGHFVTMSQHVPQEYVSYFKDTRFIDRVIKIMLDTNLTNPIKDYFLHTIHVETTPLNYSPFDLLCDHIKDKHNVARPFLKRFLIGCIARVFEGHQNYTLLLQGRQGLGKSYFAEWLCSGLSEYFQEGLILPTDKDHKLRLTSNFLWAADEFEVPRGKTAANQMKAFLSIKSVKERRPYAENPVHLPRQCSIIGTTNNIGVLTDTTGERRYLFVNLERLARGYTQIPIDDLWLEVYGWYKARQSPFLTSTEAAQQAATNAEATLHDDLQEFFQTRLRRVAGQFLENRVVREALARHYDNRQEHNISRQFGLYQEYMDKYGFVRDTFRNQRGYVDAKLLGLTE